MSKYLVPSVVLLFVTLGVWSTVPLAEFEVRVEVVSGVEVGVPVSVGLFRCFSDVCKLMDQGGKSSKDAKKEMKDFGLEDFVPGVEVHPLDYVEGRVFLAASVVSAGMGIGAAGGGLAALHRGVSGGAGVGGAVGAMGMLFAAIASYFLITVAIVGRKGGGGMYDAGAWVCAGSSLILLGATTYLQRSSGGHRYHVIPDRPEAVSLGQVQPADPEAGERQRSDSRQPWRTASPARIKRPQD